jgi:TonB family protein
MPSKTKFDPELRSDHVQNDLEVKFEITPKTVVAPVYPFKARRKQINGFVRLEFSVDESGRARDIEVIDAQPSAIFEKSAIAALEKWEFKVKDNHQGSRRLHQIFDFDMEGQDPLLSKRERRCEIAGSRICGLKVYN